MTPVSVCECHMSSPDIINVAVSTSNLSTKTCFRQKLKCNDSFIIRAFKVVIPQILRIMLGRFPTALPFCFLEITKSLTLLLINLAVLMFHARHGTCKAFYVFQICSVLHALTLSESVSSLIAARYVAGGAPGSHLPGAQPPQRDAAHHPARLQDPQDAEEEDAGGRQQRRRLGLGRVLGRE